MFKRRSRNKKVKNATANTYKGIKFRSKLERFTYQYLTSCKIPFDYEKEYISSRRIENIFDTLRNL